MLVWSADSEPPLGGRNPDDCAFEPPPSFSKYTADLALLMRICADPAVNSFAWRRLQRLESRFHLHVRRSDVRRRLLGQARPASRPCTAGDGARAARDDRAAQGAAPHRDAAL